MVCAVCLFFFDAVYLYTQLDIFLSFFSLLLDDVLFLLKYVNHVFFLFCLFVFSLFSV